MAQYIVFFVLQSAEGVEYILPVSEDVIELHSDIRLQEAQGLPTFLLAPGAEKGVHLVVPEGDDVVSNAFLFLLRMRSPRFLGRRFTTPITLLLPSQAGDFGRTVLASLTASVIASVAGPSLNPKYLVWRCLVLSIVV